MMGKLSKELFVGKGGTLFGIDWRKKDYLISFYKEREKRQEYSWMSDPHSKSIWCENGGQVTILSQDYRKLRSKKLPQTSDLRTFCWNKNYLYVLTKNEEDRQKLFRCDEHKDWQEMDSLIDDPSVNRLLVRDRQIFYGCREGTLIVKQC